MVSNHILIIRSLVLAFQVYYTLVKALALLLQVCSHAPVSIKVSIGDMDSKGYPTAHLAIVLQQGLNNPHIARGLVIPQETPNPFDKGVPRCSLGNLLSSMIFFICSPTEKKECLIQLREEVLKVFGGSRLLRAVTLLHEARS